MVLHGNIRNSRTGEVFHSSIRGLFWGVGGCGKLVGRGVIWVVYSPEGWLEEDQKSLEIVIQKWRKNYLQCFHAVLTPSRTMNSL